MKRNEKIKILYGLPSFSIGGIEKQLVQQINLLDVDKYEIYLLTLFYYPGRQNFYDQLPKHVNIYKLDFHGYFSLNNYYRLFKIISKISPDIVISSMFSANAVFRIFKIFFGYKIISREHNTYTDRTIFHRLMERLLSPLSNAIVAVSIDVANFYSKQNWVDRRKIIIINNGIDLHKIGGVINPSNDLAELRKEFNLSSSKIILNVARLKKQKDHKSLINTFHDFKNINNKYKLIIIGDGQERENLELLIKDKKLSNNVILTGFRKDVFLFYKLADFFVLSSLIEGFPNVLLEALAFGLPVVTTKVPGANEIIINNKNGFIVSNNQELLDKIVFFSKLDERAMSIYRKNCIETVNKFDIKLIVNQYEVLISKLLNL